MTLLVVGVSHRSAPVSLLERVALPPEGRAALLHDAVASGPVTAAAVLSTCNRTELYADAESFHDGLAALSGLLTARTGVAREELAPYLYAHAGERAAEHLFNVACGLDSMVVGEGQILGQVKEALALAQDEQTAGRLLNELFQQALRVGKRAHSETGIDRAGQSLVTFGLERLAARMRDGGAADAPGAGWLRGKRALVIGAGSMSSLAASVLARAGVAELVIANRTLERAERLATALDGSGEAAAPRARAVPINAISVAAELALADVVLSCTGSPGVMLGADAVASALRERASLGRRPRPLAMLDLAMPRDVDAAVHGLSGVRLVDIESLAEASADAPMAADVEAVRQIVAEEVAVFEAAQQAAQIAPTVVALRSMASEVVASELARLHGRLPDLGERERAEITRTVRRVVDKLLHAPTVRVKELAGEPGGADYAAALRELFDLDARSGPAPAASAAAPSPRRSEPGTASTATAASTASTTTSTATTTSTTTAAPAAPRTSEQESS
ncbi:glutamyl-tRNA reductase [Streptomyces sp. 7-21]|uniref:glutamyl-tRNA reductase n=1 Tax=Streptomyces sp. 7-21 TaxID=2802283 RepID=UPI00191CEB0E|nr:glutamyl-tRNA reductase [Streptomyces sp. 7-21]MBL1068985.1 glutamyl-tRNA reductase [Streptomyces sp. 7-21]